MRTGAWIVGLALASVLVEASQLVLLGEALHKAKQLQSPSNPTEPGCFVWLPSGCPGVIDIEKEETVLFAASINTSAWLHDVAGEKAAEPRSGSRQARTTRRERSCEARAKAFNTMCSVDDAAMLFVEEGTVKKPEQSGSGSVDEALDSMLREAEQPAAMGSIRLPNDQAEAAQEHLADPAAAAAEPAAEPAAADAAAAPAGPAAGPPAAATPADGAGPPAADAPRAPAAAAGVTVGAVEDAAEAKVKAPAGHKGSAKPRPRPQLIPEPLHPWAAADSAEDPRDDDLGVGKKGSDADAPGWPVAPGTASSGVKGHDELAPSRQDDDLASSEDLLAPMPVPTTAQPARLSPSTSQALPSGAPPAPEEHGCYVWTPQGCPRQPSFHGDAWKQDKYGELHNNAASGKAACFKRSSMFNAWCGVTNAVMMLVPPKKPPSPTEVGCFVWYPSGCPNQPSMKSNPTQWKHDTWAETNVNAKVDQAVCLKRKINLGTWCGTNDVEVLFVSEDDVAGALASEVADAGFATTSTPMMPAAASPPAGSEEKAAPSEAPDLPQEAGCYVWTPGGCARQSSFHAQFHWKRDTFGEEHSDAATDPAACEARKATFDMWCGVQDSVMHLVRPKSHWQPEQPAQPSPWQPVEPRRWQPEQPEQPGCYVWQPSGCPSRNIGSSNKWKHDRYGEENAGARYDAAACSKRKAKFDDFCGTNDVEMLFVTEERARVRRSPDSMPETVATMTWEQERGGYSKVYGDPDEERQPHAGKVYNKDADLLSFPKGGAHAVGGAHRAAPPRGTDAAEAPPAQGPAEAGCFVWIPGGCHSGEHDPSRLRKQASGLFGGTRQAGHRTSGPWQRDSWGEAHKGASFNRAACLARKESFDHYCGVRTAVMAWVAPARPAEPTEPGCYVWHPSGCPRKPSVKVDTEWAHDIWGENNRGAGSSEQTCASRKSQYDSFCGTSDVEMLFVGPAGGAGPPGHRVGYLR